jgi:hypothetical protein
MSNARNIDRFSSMEKHLNVKNYKHSTKNSFTVTENNVIDEGLLNVTGQTTAERKYSLSLSLSFSHTHKTR